MGACSLTDKIDNVRTGNAALVNYLQGVFGFVGIGISGVGIGICLVSCPGQKTREILSCVFECKETTRTAEIWLCSKIYLYYCMVFIDCNLWTCCIEALIKNYRDYVVIIMRFLMITSV